MQMETSMKLTENKDKLIDRLTSLTDDQKAELKAFFKNHANLENKIDWNRKGLTWEDFEALVTQNSKSKVKKQIKAGETQGLDSLVKGRDYEIVYQEENYTLYKVLTYEAMCIIASNDVEPKLMSLIPDWAKGIERNEWYTWAKEHPDEAIRTEEGEDNYYAPGAHWCIAMKKTRAYWSEYSESNESGWYVLCNSKRTHSPIGKLCIYNDGRSVRAWDANDTEYGNLSFLPEDVHKAVMQEMGSTIDIVKDALVRTFPALEGVNLKSNRTYTLEKYSHPISFTLGEDESWDGTYYQTLDVFWEGLPEGGELWDEEIEGFKKACQENKWGFVYDFSKSNDEAWLQLQIEPKTSERSLLEALAYAHIMITQIWRKSKGISIADF